MFNHPIAPVAHKGKIPPQYEKYQKRSQHGTLVRLPVRATELSEQEKAMIMVRKEGCELLKLSIAAAVYSAAFLGGFPAIITIPAAGFALYQTLSYCQFRSTHPWAWDD